MTAYPREKLRGALENSAKSAPEHLTDYPLRGYPRYRMARVRAARTRRETKRTHEARLEAALLSRSSVWLVVLLHGCCREKSTKSCASSAVSRVDMLLTKPDRRTFAAVEH